MTESLLALDGNFDRGRCLSHVGTEGPVPLVVTSDGVVVVAGTRVTLDLIVAAFLAGSTAEQIVQQYPSVALADAYATITYYLRHRNEVEAYLAQRRVERDAVRVEAERRFDPTGIRARLLARKA